MGTHICSLCNTELLDNLISCSGRCSEFFHYTCIGMSRTAFEAYKKVEGLRWQCRECLNEFKGIWNKLDDLTTIVNEVKTMINLCGMVKTAIGEAFSDNYTVIRSPKESIDAPKVRLEHPVANEKVKRRRKNKRKVTSSTPINGSSDHTIMQSDMHSSAIDLLESTVVRVNNTVAQTVQCNTSQSQVIRTAEKRTYLWLNGFHHETTTDQVIKLVSITMDVREADVICRSLKSSRRSYAELDHISFRVGLKSSDVKDALSAGKWPKGVACKLFKSKNSNVRQPVILS